MFYLTLGVLFLANAVEKDLAFKAGVIGFGLMIFSVVIRESSPRKKSFTFCDMLGLVGAASFMYGVFLTCK